MHRHIIHVQYGPNERYFKYVKILDTMLNMDIQTIIKTKSHANEQEAQ